MASLQRKRNQLLDDVRRMADGLRALAEQPSEELAAESVREASGG